MKCATVYLRNKCLYLHSSSQTDVGAWIITAPYLKIEDLNDKNKIERYIREVLNESTDGVTHPTNFNDLFKPILDIAEVKSWSAFAKNTRCCELEEEKNVITIIPTLNKGSKGFGHLNDLVLNVNLVDSNDVSEQLFEAFNRCQF